MAQGSGMCFVKIGVGICINIYFGTTFFRKIFIFELSSYYDRA
jgi:hypothetical protein